MEEVSWRMYVRKWMGYWRALVDYLFHPFCHIFSAYSANLRPFPSPRHNDRRHLRIRSSKSLHNQRYMISIFNIFPQYSKNYYILSKWNVFLYNYKAVIFKPDITWRKRVIIANLLKKRNLRKLSWRSRNSTLIIMSLLKWYNPENHNHAYPIPHSKSPPKMPSKGWPAYKYNLLNYQPYSSIEWPSLIKK